MDSLQQPVLCASIATLAWLAASAGHDAPVVSVSSASFAREAPLAPESIASAFGQNLAIESVTATSLPLPTELGGTTVVITDSTGVDRPAPLFFVSPTQVNYLIPPETAIGPATVTVTGGDGHVSSGSLEIAHVAPGLFTANATGSGVAVGSIIRVPAEGEQSAEPVAWFDPQQGVFVPTAIEFGAESDLLFLVLYATGVRNTNSPSDVTARIDGERVAVRYAGSQGDFEGLDQINLGPLPRFLSGRGEVSIELTVEGRSANRVSLRAGGPELELVTFNNEIVRIFQQRCQMCHHPGEVAPFSLMTFDDARPHASSIRSATQSRYMPPWKPVAGVGKFQGERRLTQQEIDLIARWVDLGAPEGDAADLPEPLQFSDQWTLGEPDLVATVEVPFTPDPFVDDEYRCFSIDTGLETNSKIGAIEIRPGNRRIVHHLVIFADPLGHSAALDQTDPEAGYSCFGGPGFDFSNIYGAWAPGGRPFVLPEGVAASISAGSRIVMQVHYHPDGTQQSDQTRVGFFFTDHPAPKELIAGILANLEFLIPPGARNYEVTQLSPAAPLGGRILTVFPHMHLLGQEIKLELNHPDGRVEPLILIDDWEFDWQDAYFFEEPVAVTAGSTLKLTCTYDNSSENPLNPSNPPIAVGHGEGTGDEMCVMGIGVVIN